MKNLKYIVISLACLTLISLIYLTSLKEDSKPKIIEVNQVERFYQLLNRQETKQLPWNLILVNRDHPIPDDFSIELYTLDNGKKIDVRILKPLNDMLNDAKKAGFKPFVREAYRLHQEQVEMMNYYIDEHIGYGYSKEEARKIAETFVAIPGTSEHQIALAVDINNEDYEHDGLFVWLDQNAHKYGFVKRFASEKADITKINNEPWHYRYVGVNDALLMEHYNLCLEEYIDYLDRLNPFDLYQIDYCLDLYNNLKGAN